MKIRTLKRIYQRIYLSPVHHARPSRILTKESIKESFEDYLREMIHTVDKDVSFGKYNTLYKSLNSL